MDRIEIIDFYLALTKTEREVLFWYCSRNKSQEQIARVMGIDYKTVGIHFSNISKKLSEDGGLVLVKENVCFEFRDFFQKKMTFSPPLKQKKKAVKKNIT